MPLSSFLSSRKELTIKEIVAFFLIVVVFGSVMSYIAIRLEGHDGLANVLRQFRAQSMHTSALHSYDDSFFKPLGDSQFGNLVETEKVGIFRQDLLQN